MRSDRGDAGIVSSLGGTTTILVTCVCGLAMFVGLSCRKAAPDPKQDMSSSAPSSPRPPDLHNCTRAEMEFRPSPIDFICVSEDEKLLLDSGEKAYLDSTETFVAYDRQAIVALASILDSATYKGPILGYSGKYRIVFTCDYKDGHTTSFTTIGNRLETEERQGFVIGPIDLKGLAPRVWSLQVRIICAFYLNSLYNDFRWYTREAHLSLSASEWCDAVATAYRVRGYTTNESDFLRHIRCPAVDQGKCHYAMNPDCEPNSPPDTVLLFETKAGWNQYGGPELFTFDNHDSKGGCVLLNDGTVKFIRTKEELEALRWKP